MAAMTVTTKLNSLKTLFNKVDEIYYKKAPITVEELASAVTADMELPILEDGVSFNTGDAEVTEVKITTGTTWTSKAIKGDADISFQVASIAGVINETFMEKVSEIAATTNLHEEDSYEGGAYKLSPKKVTGALFLFSEDKQTIIILPSVEIYSSLVIADGDNPAYFNLNVKPVENADGSNIFIMKKKEAGVGG